MESPDPQSTIEVDMDDQNILKLMKQRAKLQTRLDKLDARIALLRTPWRKRATRGRRYSAADRKRMSDAAKQRWIDMRKP
jgi:hypothetical protein